MVRTLLAVALSLVVSASVVGAKQPKSPKLTSALDSFLSYTIAAVVKAPRYAEPLYFKYATGEEG